MWEKSGSECTALINVIDDAAVIFKSENILSIVLCGITGQTLDRMILLFLDTSGRIGRKTLLTLIDLCLSMSTSAACLLAT